MKFVYKKKLFIFSVLAAILSICVCAVACGGSDPDPQTDPNKVDVDYTITLSHSALELSLGETVTLTAEGYSDGAVVEWKIIEGSSVISFDSDSGLITAIGVGNAIITAQSGFSRAECKINVFQNLKKHYSIDLNRKFTRIAVGQKLSMKATVRFGSEVKNDAKVEWSVIDGDAITVSDDGVVTAEREGSAIVRAVFTPTGSSSLTAYCEIRVVPELIFYKIYPDGTDTSERLIISNETFVINPQVFDADGNPVDFSQDELIISSDDPDIIEYLGDGRFRAIKSGTGAVRVEYREMDGYCDFTVWEFKASESLENVGNPDGSENNWWGGSVMVRTDGKLHYVAPAYYSAVALRSDALDEIKYIANTYGYTKLVITLYSVSGDLENLLVEGKFNVSGNVGGMYNRLKETDSPVRYSIEYADFKDWTDMQIIASFGAATDVTFTLSLEKFEITAEDTVAKTGDAFGIDKLKIAVTEKSRVISGLTYEDFTITSLDPEIVSYADGVFTAQAEGQAVIRIEYNGIPTYVTVEVLGAIYTVPFKMYSVGEYTSGSYTDWGGGSVFMHQYNWDGYFSLEIAGENWTKLKEIATEHGYTNIVLTIYEKYGDCTIDNSGTDCFVLNGSGEYPVRHVNSFADHAGQDRLVVLVESTYWETAGTNAIWFSVTLEKYEVKAEYKAAKVGDAFGIDGLNVAVVGKTETIGGLTYEDFTITSLDPEIVSYANGVFTAQAEGRAVIRIEYNGIPTCVTIDVVGIIYTVPFHMYSVGEYTDGSYYDWGSGLVCMVQNQKDGYFSLEIAGENWAQLKKIAADCGYTTIVLNVDTANSTGAVTHNDSGANCLKWSGSNGRYVNDFANYADKEKLVVLVENTYWETDGLLSIAFYVTLEKQDNVTEDVYTVPLAYYSIGAGSGTIDDVGCACFIPSSVPSSVVISGENWAAVKTIAAEHGYTKIVLRIIDEWGFSYGSGAGCLALTGGGTVGTHVNDYADFSANDELIVVIGNAVGRSTYFIVTLEK